MVLLLVAFNIFLVTYAVPLDNKVTDLNPLHYLEVHQWPRLFGEIGDVSGIDTRTDNTVIILHRAYRVWDHYSFSPDWIYQKKNDGPIMYPVILALDQKTGTLLKSGGSFKYYLPHGLTVDHNNDIWITDVALHQVIKLKGDTFEPVMTLGTEFTPGSDSTHFCAPTDVAVASNGQFFVSDGYCNSRILKFSADGHLLKEWGQKNKGVDPPGDDELLVPHSLALMEDDDLICVADRENKRIQCYEAGLKDESATGRYSKTLLNNNHGRIFAIAFDKNNNLLHAISNQQRLGSEFDVGITMKAKTGQIIDEWAPLQGFGAAHDVAVSKGGMDLYVGDVRYHRVWKFTRDRDHL